MTTFRNLAAVSSLSLALACGSHVGSRESVGHSQQADSPAVLLNIPVLPDPCAPSGTSRWNGTRADLLVADAMTECSASSQSTPPTYDGFFLTPRDEYALYVSSLMQSVAPVAGSQSVTSAWAAYRGGSNNCDPLTHAAGAPVTLRPQYIPYSIAYGVGDPQHEYANRDLRQAPQDLCVAQRLRDRMPGAAGNEALFFTDYEQLQLLEVIRERSQMAMLQYALLGEAFSFVPNSSGPNAGSTDGQVRLPILSAWAASAGANQLRAMANEFAAAVHLHGVVTEELAKLFARSRSARLLRDDRARPLAVELWGSGSWYQRLLALSFGGDPLANGPDGSWTEQTAYATPVSQPGTFTLFDWPSAFTVPFLSSEVNAPQVGLMFDLARHFNVVELQPAANGTLCAPYDAQLTATTMYTKLEQFVRTRDCFGATNGVCPSVQSVPPIAQYAQYLVWKKYGISPDHARQLAAHIIDAVTPSNPVGQGCWSGSGLASSMAVADTKPSSGTPTLSLNGGVLHISSTAAFTPHSIPSYVGQFTRLVPFRAADASELEAGADVGSYGFDGGCVYNQDSHQGFIGCTIYDGHAAESKRAMGAVSAEVAVREMIVSTLALPSATPARAAFLAQAPAILNEIAANVGSTTTSVTPVIAIGDLTNPPNSQGYPTYVGRGAAWAGERVRITYDPRTEDGVWFHACTAMGTTCTLIATSGALPTQLSEHPEVTWSDGSTLPALLAAAPANLRVTYNPSSLSPSGAQNVEQLLFSGFWPSSDGSYSFVLDRQLGTAHEYRLIAGNIYITQAPNEQSNTWLGIKVEQDPIWNGSYFGTGGGLGAYVAQQGAVSPSNPVEPAFDGFGLPNHWVPPFTAALAGGAADQDSASYFMAQAANAAEAATQAVTTAIQSLAAQEQDASQLRAAQAKASETFLLDRASLCGTGSAGCDPNSDLLVATKKLSELGIYPNVPSSSDCDINTITSNKATDLGKCKVNHVVYTILNSFMNGSVAVSAPVAAHLADPSAPLFSEYSGGELQQDFIEQWRALREPADRLAAVLATRDTALSNIDLAGQVNWAYRSELHDSCSPDAMGDAEQAGESGGISVGGSSSGWSASVSASYSDGPLIAQQQKCLLLKDGLDAAEQQLTTSLVNAFGAMSAALVGFVEAQGRIAASSAKVQSAITQAAVADARAKLDQTLTSLTQSSNLEINRHTRDYETWRAQALVENARRYGLTARRAIEARYVIDLSRAVENEPFVAAPSSWADAVYGYDLSLPAAVGLSLGAGNTVSGGVYANVVKDYVANLQGFMSGYAVKRPSAISHSDIDVVNLPGLQAGALVTLPDGSKAYPDLGKWTVHCGGSADAWVSIPYVTGLTASTCASGVIDAARLDFSLDPWGQLNGTVSNPPFANKFNDRWGALALNFVGTGVRDCSKATDPSGCYAQGFIPYTLSHVGVALVTDYDEFWHSFNLPSGRIEGGKGLAAEIWLDPLKDGWSTSYVSAVARSEFDLRPLGGAYELQFRITPDIVPQKMERVQLLVGSNSWVKQQ